MPTPRTQDTRQNQTTAMSIAMKQTLVIVVAFLFLLVQLGIKRASVKPRELSSTVEADGLEEIRAEKSQQFHIHEKEQASFQRSPKKHKPHKSNIHSNSNEHSKLPGNKTKHSKLTPNTSGSQSGTQSRLESARAEYIRVCKTLGSKKQSAVVKYSSYAFGRLQWCSVPKSGTTFLTRDLRPTLRRNGENGADTPKRFIVVREPYARLVSAYFSKIVGHPSWWFTFGTKIISGFRPNTTSNNLHCGYDVTFQEFVKFFIYSVGNSKFKNDHFLPIHMVCDMCEDPPEFIAKIETLKTDMEFVLSSVNVSGSTGKSFIEVRHLAKLFMSFKGRFQGCAPMCSLLGRFWWGQQATGLIAEDIALPVKGQACDQVTADQLAKLAWDAHIASVDRIGDKKRHKLKTSRQLWRQVPLEDKVKVREIVTLDCRLFGYDCTPDFVFPGRQLN